MRVLSWRASVEWPAGAVESRAETPESIGQDIVCQRDDLGSGRMEIAMHIADEMANARRLGEVARMHDENLLVCGADDIGSLGVVVKKLSRMKNRTGWQFEREDYAVRRFDETPDSTAIDRAHRKFDDRQAGRRLTMRMKDAHRNWGRGRGHMAIKGKREKAKGKR